MRRPPRSQTERGSPKRASNPFPSGVSTPRSPPDPGLIKRTRLAGAVPSVSQEVKKMQQIKILGLAFALLSFLPALLSAAPQYPAATAVVWAAPDRDDWGYRDRDDDHRRYRDRDRDDRRYWNGGVYYYGDRDRDDRRWHRKHWRDRDDRRRH